ncbi:hypothetical protein EKO04_010549 [Ascochyta lentis]|uniref:Uncharacterized protein n=1 Tax=Ascochyta lentis TaxID=205686 RepID=A0A8H7MDY3_9PLEO|nr:hypothetical protein EKO04_010549 [Ascochyta lentis]
MCTQVFVETETPSALFVSGGASRGGFSEMTVFKQRFNRWNFFFVNSLYYNLLYILGCWKLGYWEVGTKIFVFQEIYETILYLMTPFVLPITLIVRPGFTGILIGATVLMYLVNTVMFNEIHLRRKNEHLSWILVYVYYIPYKIALSGINVAGCYWSLYKYSRYFAVRHLKITENERAVGIVALVSMPASIYELWCRDIDALWDDFAKKGIVVDVYVANAAKFTEAKRLLELGSSEVWSQMEANLRSPLYFTEKLHAQASDKQTIVSLHPGLIYNEYWKSLGIEAKHFDSDELTGACVLWAATKEAAFLHGRFIWCSWDVNELATGAVRERLDKDFYYLRASIVGLQEGLKA